MSHEYTTELNYPIQLVNSPKGKVIVGVPPRTVQIRVKAYGYTLLRYKLIALLSPIKINLNGAKEISKTDGSDYFLLMSNKFSSIVSQLSDDIILLGVQPDTLYFSMAAVVDKVVKIKPEINATYANQYMLAGSMRITPQNITVTGPRSIIDTIYEVKTKQVTLNLLSETNKLKVQLQPIQQISFSQNEVNVEIPIEKFTETTLEILLVPINIPDNAQIVLLPEKVSVKCNVIVSKFFLLKPNQFRLVCDFKDNEAISGGKVRVTIEKHPNYVGRIDFQPKYVDYIIKSK